MKDTLRHGSAGSDVRQLQTILNTLGENIAVDGIFGDGTFSAVCDFQTWKGLEPDGVVGPKTWDAIEQAMANHAHGSHTRAAVSDGLAPCSAEEALARMEALKLLKDAEYQLGTGDYNRNVFALKYDCAGAAICEAYKLTRHRKGFATGTPKYHISDVDDDINTNSALEDAWGKQELFVIVEPGEPVLPGDLVMWATIRMEGSPRPKIGHVLMVKSLPEGFVHGKTTWGLVTMLQCCGPNGRKPAIIETDGRSIDRHNAVYTAPGQGAYVVRVKQIP
jgi:hypothetical protein